METHSRVHELCQIFSKITVLLPFKRAHFATAHCICTSIALFVANDAAISSRLNTELLLEGPKPESRSAVRKRLSGKLASYLSSEQMTGHSRTSVLRRSLADGANGCGLRVSDIAPNFLFLSTNQ